MIATGNGREADWTPDPVEMQRWFAGRIESLASVCDNYAAEARRVGNAIARCYFTAMADELRRDAATARAPEPEGG